MDAILQLNHRRTDHHIDELGRYVFDPIDSYYEESTDTIYFTRLETNGKSIVVLVPEIACEKDMHFIEMCVTHTMSSMEIRQTFKVPFAINMSDVVYELKNPADPMFDKLFDTIFRYMFSLNCSIGGSYALHETIRHMTGQNPSYTPDDIDVYTYEEPETFNAVMNSLMGSILAISRECTVTCKYRRSPMTNPTYRKSTYSFAPKVEEVEEVTEQLTSLSTMNDQHKMDYSKRSSKRIRLNTQIPTQYSQLSHGSTTGTYLIDPDIEAVDLSLIDFIENSTEYTATQMDNENEDFHKHISATFTIIIKCNSHVIKFQYINIPNFRGNPDGLFEILDILPLHISPTRSRNLHGQTCCRLKSYSWLNRPRFVGRDSLFIVAQQNIFRLQMQLRIGYGVMSRIINNDCICYSRRRKYEEKGFHILAREEAVREVHRHSKKNTVITYRSLLHECISRVRSYFV